MTDSLSDIEFLARSAHRLQVLEKLSEGQCGRAELQRRSGVSRSTILRTLSDMEEKGWVKSDDWQYNLTTLGEIMYAEFTGTLATADTVRRLNRVIEWLPVETIEVDLRRFRDATISIASRNDPTLPAREYAKLKTTDGHVQSLIYGLDPFGLTEHKRALEETDQQYEGVFSAGLYNKIQTRPDIMRETRTVVANQQTAFYRHDEEIPLHIVIADDTVGLLLTSADGTFPAFIGSQNRAVVSWATEKFEYYREHSVPVSASGFS